MLTSMLGTKVGMTQVFDDAGNVVPVTVIDLGRWYVTQIKTQERDGYTAVQLGLPREKYRAVPFSPEWLKNKNDYFLHVQEVPCDSSKLSSFVIGQQVTSDAVSFDKGDRVAVVGTSKGIGFQGVMKRWGFAGGPDSHGSNFHRRPGSSGHLRRQGEVIKGKRFPGHTGVNRVTIKGLTVVRIDKEHGCLFVKGAVPGKKDGLLSIEKQER